MSEESPSTVPPPSDPENLRRLREEAQKRLDQEQTRPPYPAPAYGSPPIPAPAYGGPAIKASWFSPKRAIFLVLGFLVAIAAWALLGGRVPWINPAPVYGGPPLPAPRPPAFILHIPGAGRLFEELVSRL
jgi:hypothetical protein